MKVAPCKVSLTGFLAPLSLNFGGDMAKKRNKGIGAFRVGYGKLKNYKEKVFRELRGEK